MDDVARQGTPHKDNCQQSAVEVEKIKFYAKLKGLCRQKVNETFVDLYYSLVKEFPNATNRIKFMSIRRSMFQWRYPEVKSLPRTMLDVNELMRIP